MSNPFLDGFKAELEKHAVSQKMIARAILGRANVSRRGGLKGTGEHMTKAERATVSGAELKKLKLIKSEGGRQGVRNYIKTVAKGFPKDTAKRPRRSRRVVRKPNDPEKMTERMFDQMSPKKQKEITFQMGRQALSAESGQVRQYLKKNPSEKAEATRYLKRLVAMKKKLTPETAEKTIRNI